MALFKILKGQEKNLPTNKTEGWAYVTTDEGNMYVDVSASKRVKIGAHADTAVNADKLDNLHASNFDLKRQYSLPGTSNSADNARLRYSKFATLIFNGAWQAVDFLIDLWDMESQSYTGTFRFTMRTAATVATHSIGNFYWTYLSSDKFTSSIVMYKIADGKYELYFVNPVNQNYNITYYKVQYLYGDSYITFQNGSAWTTVEPTYVSGNKYISKLSEASSVAEKWKTARNFRVADNSTTNFGNWISVDGSATNYTLQLPSTIKASITGHASEDLPLSGGTMTGTINSQIIQPKTNNAYTLGSSSNRWSTLYSVNINNTGSWTWYGNQNFLLKATANNQEWSFDQCYGSTSFTGTYSQFWSSKNSVSIIRFYTDDNQVQIPSTGFMGIGGAGDANYKLKVTGNTYLTGTLYVGGGSTFNSNLTVNSGGKVKIQNITDSKNSQDSNASLAIQGGVSVAKQLSAKTVRIDGSSSDTTGSTTQGCTVHFNKTNNCIEFVFD